MWNPVGDTLYVSEEAKNIAIVKQTNREWLVQRVIEIEMFLIGHKNLNNTLAYCSSFTCL